MVTSADLDGCDLDGAFCVQCGGAFCDFKYPRLIDGKVVVLCGRKPEGKALLMVLDAKMRSLR